MKLHDACEAGRKAEVKKLVESGVDIDSRDTMKRTPLLVAAAHGKNAVVSMLVEMGAALDAIDYKMMSALHLAAAGGHSKVVQTLLEHKADCSLVDSHGEIALQLAIKTPVHMTAAKRKELVTRLVDAGSDLHFVSNMNQAALHYAIRKGAPEIVGLLLAKGADPTGPKGTRDPLELAEQEGNAKIIKMIVKARE